MSPFTIEAYPVGVLPVPGWEAFFGTNDPSFHDLTFYVWHLSDGEHHVLLDLGLPPGPADRAALDRGCQAVDPRCTFGDVRSLDQALDAFGLCPEQIDLAVLTQPITYHSGGLVAKYLPRAEVVVPLAGLVEMLAAPVGHPATELYFTAAGWSYLRELAVHGRLRATDGPEELLPGLWFETTGGHHPGSAATRVTTADGEVAIVETAFFQRNVDEAHPIGIAEDTAQCRRTVQRLRTQCDHVVAIHEPANAVQFPLRPTGVAR